MWSQHHDLKFELPNDWLAEAGMESICERVWSYVARDVSKPTFTISVQDVKPLYERQALRGVFCDGEEGTARVRVVRILKWIRDRKPIEPVDLVHSIDPQYKYELKQGSHRFHCAIAVGIEKLPATLGFDMRLLDT